MLEYRVSGSSAVAMFGPTKNREVAEKLLANRAVTYGPGHPWGPWRLQAREVGDWHDITGTLFEGAQ